MIRWTIMTLMMSTSAMALADVSSNLNALGGNRDLMRRAKAIEPGTRVKVVQNRSVDRNWRVEFGVNYGVVAGGDPYVDTNNLGLNLDLHITPRFSIGGRYYSSNNSLSSEGKRVFDNAAAARAIGGTDPRGDINFVSDTYMGVINWYPMYGKISLFERGLAQFDMYLLAGGGQVRLKDNQSAPTYTAGGGMGFWWTQHFTTRLEVRYQTYEDQITSGPRQIDLTVFSASLGLML